MSKVVITDLSLQTFISITEDARRAFDKILNNPDLHDPAVIETVRIMCIMAAVQGRQQVGQRGFADGE